MLTVDVHQHLLTEPLIAELARRKKPPLLVKRREGGWTFKVAGEPDSVLSFEATDVETRWTQVRRDEIDRALVSLSAALGIETLPAEQATPLIEAHQAGIDVLPARFGSWGAVQLTEPDPRDVDAALRRGCVGISLPATALATPAALELAGPLLERLEASDAPLFVHPGPVSTSHRAAATMPGWWPALTDYVAQMQAAWFAFLQAGRPAHPRLRVLFAMCAGGAPLQLERYAARSGKGVPVPDPLVFYDTSSYGAQMLAPIAGIVGAGQLVYGTDRPVVDGRAPRLDGTLREALLSANPTASSPTERRLDEPPAIEGLLRPHGRDLEPDELIAVATQIARRKELWAHYVAHDPSQRTFKQLLRDEHLDVWLLCWSHDHDTGFHDHDLSAGAVAVAAGQVREERLVLGRPLDQPISRTAGAGSSFSFAASDIHRVLHAGYGSAVTIHAYSPPLVRMGSYAVEDNGQLRRYAVSHEDELRQLDAAALS